MKVVHTSYNFIGDVVSMSENVYSHNNGAKYVLAKRTTVNAYHPGTRLLASTTITQTDKNGATSTQVVSSPSYDVFGNVIADNRPGTAADMTYAYDQLHGWLSSVSSPCGFSEQLLRETATNALFSGNIGSMLWRNSAVGEQHRYDYTYDSLGRLTDAHYSSSVNGTDGRYDESAAYNANGSVTWLLRGGMKNDGSFGAIDSLVVTYDGNRLLKVTDHAEALNYNGALDFHDGENTNCEYAYDSDGALTRDGNRGVSSITYDYDHHPYYIRMSDGKSYTRNDYTPGGCKLLSTHIAYIPKGNGSYSRKMTKNMYVDGLVLRGGKPLLWRFDGGYVELNDNGTPTGWNYYVTDHLGSTRMVVSSNDSIKETINYYPFGSEMRMQPPALLTEDTRHPFRFTGKELEKINSLNWYDFGARWYDVAGVPMWTSIDPLCEKYYSVSPYVYCHNNPVMLIDPDGRDDYFDNKGHFIWRTSSGSNVMVMCGNQYKNITEIDFSNSISAVENIGRHYMEKSDNDFNLTASSTGGDIPQDAAFSNRTGTQNYYINLTNGYVNKALGDCYNFECITFHESTHRYDSSTHGGTIGEVNAIMRTAKECSAWSMASDDYIQAQASYAARSLNKYLKDNPVPNGIIQNLNSTFDGYATFELNDKTVSVNYSLKGWTIYGKDPQKR